MNPNKHAFIPKLCAVDEPPVAIDFESYYDDVVSIKTLGADLYLRHPLCDLYLVTVYDGEQRFTGRPEDFDWPSLDGRLLVSWNAAHDKLCHDHLARRGLITACSFGEWNCAANLSVYLRNKRSLKPALKIFFDKHVSKDYRKLAKAKQEVDMRADGSWAVIEQSNIDDTIDTHRFWVECSPRWPMHERRASVMTIEQSHRGLQINMPLVLKGIKVLEDRKTEIAENMPWPCTADEGVASIEDAKKYCEVQKIPMPASTSEDTMACREWEKVYGEKFPFISHMRDWRKCNIRSKRLQCLRDRSKQIGKAWQFIFAQKYFGAHTGRHTGGSRGGTEETGFSTQTFGKEPLHGVDERMCVVASPGRKLIIADASQIEPRSLTWLSGDEAKLAKIRKGISVYQVHAEETMGWKPGVDLKKADKSKYQLSKIRVLGLGFGCGHVKFKVFAEVQYEYLMSLIESKKQVVDFRNKEKKIIQLWNRMHADFDNSINDPEILELPGGKKVPVHRVELPSGRFLTYFNPIRERRSVVFAKKKTKKQLAEEAAKKLASGIDQDEMGNASDYRLEMCAQVELTGPRGFYYGGILTENVTQACAHDVFEAMGQRIEDEFGIYAPIMFTSHDEMILDADKSITTKEVEEVMSISPSWMPDCPFGAEANESDYYCK